MINKLQILRAIGNENLSLYRGNGYWYFVYDDDAELYGDVSVPVMNLNHLDLDSWVAYGRDLIAQVEAAV
jgi:hypothetical protein